MEASKKRAGTVAIVGRPNVGKSTLLNGLLGQKIAIVSPRPQTTRNRILGVRTEGDVQLVLLDTPGIHRRRANINRFMVKEALDSLSAVDVVVVVTEVGARPARLAEDALPRPAELDAADRYVLEQVSNHGGTAPVVLVLNKIDHVRDRTLLLPLMESLGQHGFAAIVPMSALRGDGLESLISELASSLPEGDHLYPEDMVTDRAERFLVGELIREQVFLQAHEEIPFGTAVEVDQFDERSEKGDVVIDATIFVERDGQKAILIGRRGARIKELGIKARQQVENLLGCPAHLNLTVRVSKDWTKHPGRRRRFGYE